MTGIQGFGAYALRRELKGASEMRTRLLINVGLIIAAALATSSIAFAQASYPTPPVVPLYGPSTEGHRPPSSMKAAAAAPKPAYDAHDLSGVWWGRGNSILM